MKTILFKGVKSGFRLIFSHSLSIFFFNIQHMQKIVYDHLSGKKVKELPKIKQYTHTHTHEDDRTLVGYEHMWQYDNVLTF